MQTNVEIKKGEVKIWRKEGAFGNFISQSIFLRLLGSTIYYFKDNEDAIVMGKVELDPTSVAVVAMPNLESLPPACAGKTFSLKFCNSPPFIFSKKTFLTTETLKDCESWVELLCQKLQTWHPVVVSTKNVEYPPMGYLEKKNPRAPGWKKRFFILEPEKRILTYYIDVHENKPLSSLKGSLYIPKTISIYAFNDMSDTFQIHTRHRKYILKAPHRESQKAWMNALHACTTIISTKLLPSSIGDSVSEPKKIEKLEDNEHSLVLQSVSESETVLKGYLKKLSPSKIKGWQRRFFWVKNFVIYWGEERTNQATTSALERTIDMSYVVKIEKVDETKSYTFNVVCEKRTYHLAAYNESEFNAWVNGLTKLRVALKWPTPYDFTKCGLIKRSVKDYTKYSVDEKFQPDLQYILPFPIEEDEEAKNFRSEMCWVINSTASTRKSTKICALETTEFPFPSFLPQKFNITFIFSSRHFIGKLPKKTTIPCAVNMTFREALKYAFISGYFAYVREVSQKGVEKFSSFNVRELYQEMYDVEKGVSRGIRNLLDDTYQDCASAYDIIEWLAKRTTWKRTKCVAFGLLLLDKGLLRPLTALTFDDNESLYYFESPPDIQSENSHPITISSTEVFANYNVLDLFYQLSSSLTPSDNIIEDVVYPNTMTGIQILEWLRGRTFWGNGIAKAYISTLLDNNLLELVVGLKYHDNNLYKLKSGLQRNSSIREKIEPKNFALSYRSVSVAVALTLVEGASEQLDWDAFYNHLMLFYYVTVMTIGTEKTSKFVYVRVVSGKSLEDWLVSTFQWNNKKVNALGTAFIQQKYFTTTSSDSFSTSPEAIYECKYFEEFSALKEKKVNVASLRSGLFTTPKRYERPSAVPVPIPRMITEEPGTPKSNDPTEPSTSGSNNSGSGVVDTSTPKTWFITERTPPKSLEYTPRLAKVRVQEPNENDNSLSLSSSSDYDIVLGDSSKIPKPSNLIGSVIAEENEQDDYSTPEIYYDKIKNEMDTKVESSLETPRQTDSTSSKPKSINETIDGLTKEWFNAPLQLRVATTILGVDSLDRKLGSFVRLRDNLSRRVPIQFVVEDEVPSVEEPPRMEVPDPTKVLQESCYDINSVDRKFEIYIGKISGIDLNLLRPAYGEDWHPSLNNDDIQGLETPKKKEESNPELPELTPPPQVEKSPVVEYVPPMRSITSDSPPVLPPFNRTTNKKMTLQLGTRSSLSLRPITPRSNAGNEAGTLQRGQSLYDSTNSIRKGLLGVKILEPSLPLDNIRLPDMWIEVNFYFGGVEIAPSLRTRKSMYPKWKQWLRSNTPLNTLPKETRIYITLYGTDPNGQAVSLGWTVWPLFNWNGYLPMGKFQEELRRGGKLNPLIATAAPPEENKMVINVKMPSSPLPVAFPEGIRQRVARNYPTDINQIREDDRALLEKVFENDPLTALNKDEKKLVWKFRRYCLENSPQNLPKVMLSVQWRKPECLKDAHDLIQQWPLLKPHESLELLESSFPDNSVRAFAIQCLEKATDQELVRYLPQLVQVLKYENYHLGPLSTFLVRRALDNVLIVGVNLFWHLYTELHNPEIRMRYSLMIEAFLAGIVDYRSNLLVQVKMVKFFEETSKFLQGQNLAIRRKLLISKMKNLVDDLPPVFSSPIDPTITLRGINVEKCKIMDSNAAPLWIEFLTKEDPDVEDIFPVLVKCGDDPRQDILTLEMFSIMDHLWRSEGMELGMTIYKVVATGPTSGMVEIVRNSTTTAKIQKEFSGAAGAFSKKPLKTWLENNNTDRNCLAEAIDNFTRSCAASCVATHVIGIGDRHNDNVMVTKTGHLFHIDFGHFLGNVLKFGTFNRDAAPFVLTPEFVFVMGDETGKDYMRFREISSKAYVIVRKFYRIFLILFHMMLSTGIPQLRSVEDIEYLRAVFNLDCNEEAAEEKWKMLIDESLRTKTTQINNFIHNIAHPS